ncbi:hypothetical protein EDC56_2312 [Sinobacterium caligoides]|uniref:YgjP-like metallopeptidase domain-containing protein n=1 Tax=Sinobacterium caligoides TaxID=933926 RepID=A0A3N2DQ00_9GAMM|nr:YgjP-like metallopeptidase domain-containing protein [Sinobacterium caligoides]ROS01863.1 hypothetical protein EDC56_2312 [Sinobacterium caligoides]
MPFLSSYPEQVQLKVQQLIDNGELLPMLRKRYPMEHQINNNRSLYDYTITLKNHFIKKSSPLSKVVFDGKLIVAERALGLHIYSRKVQGSKTKSKNIIKIAEVFKQLPAELLKMIVVHELAHLKHKDHDKAFYKLCCHMAANYHQLEFDTRLFLTAIRLENINH